MPDVGASSGAHLTQESALEPTPDSDRDLALLGAGLPATRGGRSQRKDKGPGATGPYSWDSLAT